MTVRATIGPEPRVNLDTFDPLVDVSVGDRGIFCEGTVNGTTDPVDLAQVNPWNDQFGIANLQNSTPGSRPLVRWPFGLFYQQVCLFFDQVDDVVSADNATPTSLWTFLHDGTGGLLSGVFFCGSAATAQDIAATCNGATPSIGIELRLNGTDQTINVRVLNGTGVLMVNVTTAPGTVPINRIVRWVYRFQTGLAPNNEWELWINGVLIAGGTTAAAPSAAAPSNRLTLGRQTTAGARLFLGWMAACHAYKSPLLYLEREIMRLERMFS